MDIRQAILESAHLFHAPNDSMGYGIPDMWRAHELLLDEDVGTGQSESVVELFPNPVGSDGTLRWSLSEFADVELADDVFWTLTASSGSVVAEGSLPIWETPTLKGHLELAPYQLAPGSYVMTLSDGTGEWAAHAVLVLTRTP